MSYPRQYGTYTLLESIGKGGMSAIDLAQTTVADAQYVRFLVIKRIQNEFAENDSYVRMFQDEARITAELQHANIAQVYDFGQQGNEFFLAMEYIPGIDVRQLQRALAIQRKGIPVRISMRILAEVLDALEYAHTRIDVQGRPLNIVHRDVNPRNMMLSIRGEVKLIDFGVAKAENKLDKTVGHTLKGKFAYMSPEQFEGTTIDSRADLFAIGLVLHELADGARPFKGLTEFQIMHRIISGNIPSLMGPRDHPHPAMIHEIHRKALTKDPNERYQSAAQMRRAIENAMDCCGGLATNLELTQFLQQVIPKKINEIAGRLEAYTREVTTKIEDPTLILARHAKIPPSQSDAEIIAEELPPTLPTDPRPVSAHDATSVTVTTPSKQPPAVGAEDNTQVSASWTGKDPLPEEGQRTSTMLLPNRKPAPTQSAVTEISKTQPRSIEPTKTNPLANQPRKKVSKGRMIGLVSLSVLLGLSIASYFAWMETQGGLSPVVTSTTSSSSSQPAQPTPENQSTPPPSTNAQDTQKIKTPTPAKQPKPSNELSTSTKKPSNKAPKIKDRNKAPEVKDTRTSVEPKKPENTPPSTNSSASTKEPTSPGSGATDPAVTTISNEQDPPNPRNTAKLEATSNLNPVATNKAEVTTPPIVEAPKAVKQVSVYLMVGTTSGIRNLPIYLDKRGGRLIGKTGVPKKTRLPVGKHRLVVVNPETDDSVEKSFVVPSNGGSVTVEIRGL